MKRLTSLLQKWVADPPDGDKAMEIDPLVHEEHGLTLKVRAFPRRNRDRAGPTIGIRHFPVQTVKTSDDLRSTLKGKATKYGDLDHPYVVALNALGMYAYPHHAVDALFGSLVWQRAPSRTAGLSSVRSAPTTAFGGGRRVCRTLD